MAPLRDFAPDLDVSEALFGRYQLRPRDLLHIQAHSTEHGLDDARACAKYVRELCSERGRKVRLIVDLRGSRGITAEARSLYASEGHARNIIGVGLVIDSGLSRVVGNFALALNRSQAPRRLFNTVAEAIEWLESLPDE